MVLGSWAPPGLPARNQHAPERSMTMGTGAPQPDRAARNTSSSRCTRPLGVSRRPPSGSPTSESEPAESGGHREPRHERGKPPGKGAHFPAHRESGECVLTAAPLSRAAPPPRTGVVNNESRLKIGERGQDARLEQRDVASRGVGRSHRHVHRDARPGFHVARVVGGVVLVDDEHAGVMAPVPLVPVALQWETGSVLNPASSPLLPLPQAA